MIDLLAASVLSSQAYNPPNYGGPKTTRGSGTRLHVSSEIGRSLGAAVGSVGVIDSSAYPGTTGANMRESPNGRVLIVVPNGKTVKILGQDGDWLLCQYERVHGWIFKDLVKR